MNLRRKLLFPGFLLQEKFNSKGHMTRVRCPVLAITGARDETIPTELTRALFDNWHGQLAEHEVPEGRHRGLRCYPSVRSAVAAFLPVTLGGTDARRSATDCAYPE